MRKTSLLLIAALSLAGGETASAATEAEVKEKLIGQWQVDEIVNQGVEVEDEQIEGTYTMITDKEIITYDKEKKETYRATYKLNVNAKPMQIDMVSKMNSQDVKALGIIEFEWLNVDGEKEFKLAYSLKPGERPKEFKSEKGSMIMLMELEQEND